MESEPTRPLTFCQFSPRHQPAAISSALQAAEPEAVGRANRPSGIAGLLAGIETTLRTPGNDRPKNTTHPSYR